jgi:hypothetical protein
MKESMEDYTRLVRARYERTETQRLRRGKQRSVWHLPLFRGPAPIFC